jgi:hypothetical protein
LIRLQCIGERKLSTKFIFPFIVLFITITLLLYIMIVYYHLTVTLFSDYLLSLYVYLLSIILILCHSFLIIYDFHLTFITQFLIIYIYDVLTFIKIMYYCITPYYIPLLYHNLLFSLSSILLFLTIIFHQYITTPNHHF